jgi:hypothetical protein
MGRSVAETYVLLLAPMVPPAEDREEQRHHPAPERTARRRHATPRSLVGAEEIELDHHGIVGVVDGVDLVHVGGCWRTPAPAAGAGCGSPLRHRYRSV